MKTLRKLPAVIALTLGLALAGSAAAQTMKVATVNAAKVFNELQETKDLKAKMENERKTLEAQEVEKKTRIKDLQSARDALKVDSPQYDEKNQELIRAAIDLEVWGRMTQATVGRNQKQQMMNLFNKITATVAEVATAKGIDLVLAEQRPDNLTPEQLEQINVDQMRALINSRNVLFSTPNVDISNDVIATMDAKYKAGK